jgi:hypothetical protein
LAFLSGHDFGSVIQAVYGNAFVRVALALVAADILSGVAVAFKNGDFHLAEVGELPALEGGALLPWRRRLAAGVARGAA